FARASNTVGPGVAIPMNDTAAKARSVTALTGSSPAAQQEQPLLAGEIGQAMGADRRRAPVGVDGDGALDADSLGRAELHEILDGAEVDIGRRLPGMGQAGRDRHGAASQ